MWIRLLLDLPSRFPKNLERREFGTRSALYLLACQATLNRMNVEVRGRISEAYDEVIDLIL